jgi:hypothetical protein
MRHIILTTLILGLLFFGCNQADNKTVSVTGQKVSTSTDHKEQIQNLIRQVFEWVDSKDAISAFPAKTDRQDSVIVGVDLEIHKQALVKLRQTNLFASEFIDNYNQIVLTLDEGLKNDKYGQWLVGEYPPFSFASGWNPWCCSQGDCAGESFEIEIIKLDSDAGVLKYKRGKDSSWVDFNIRVSKENGKWKIAYLQGFDFKDGTKRDGEL